SATNPVPRGASSGSQICSAKLSTPECGPASTSALLTFKDRCSATRSPITSRSTTSSRSDDTEDGHHFKTNTTIQTCQQQSRLNKKMTASQSRNPAPAGKKKERKIMNTLTQFKKILILPLLIALSLVVAAPARATPSCGLTTVILALEHFP